MTRKYNKLVRDRIPEVIMSSGQECKTRILADEEYLRMLDAKLDEELAEYHNDQNIEELADLLEVVYALAELHGASEKKLNSIRTKKKRERGGFAKKILLVEAGE